MNSLITIRENLKDLYARYDVYFRPVLKFALSLMIFIAINSSLGYLNALNHLFILVILAVICAILPMNGMVVIGMVLIVAHSFGLGVEVGGFAAALYLLMMLMYFRFVPDDALVLILTPVAFIFHVPLLVPLTLGLIGGPLSIISVILGLISWRFIDVVSTVVEPIKNSSDSTVLDVIQAIPKNIFSQELILTVIVFAAVILVCAAIRKLIAEHSWEIAILVGTVLYAGLTVAGTIILKIDTDYIIMAVGIVVAAAAAFVLEFFLYSADYSGTEYLQFEDDRYYYNVKIIPKTMVSERKKEQEEEQAPGTGELSENSGRSDGKGNAEDLMAADATKMLKSQNLQDQDIDLESKLEESLRNINANQQNTQTIPLPHLKTGKKDKEEDK